MKLTVLASGPSGMPAYLEFKGKKYLIDCGITYRQLKLRLEQTRKKQ